MMSVTDETGRAHNSEREVWLPAPAPAGALGKEADLLIDNSMVSLLGN